MKAYIESTVPSYYVARPSNSLIKASRQATTRQWWDSGFSGCRLYTSLETLDEVSRGDKELAQARVAMLNALPLLPLNDAVEKLATSLVTSGLIPRKAASDAVHIAVASVHKMSFIVTWNLKHIANPFLRERLRKQVEEAGYELPVICTPEELLANEDD